MANTTQNNKRIAKNAILLYIRMFIMMLVSLYTSRIILNVLGVEDFGIYNIIGGVVGMMGVFNTSMSVATSRFITYELGRGDEVELKQIFSIAINIYVLYAVIFIIVAEFIGLWLINTQLTIPDNKINAAHWLFQFSIFSVVAMLLYTPYNAIIIAHEKMDVYAYISLIEAFLKLVIAFLIQLLDENRLIYYGFFIMLSSLFVSLSYAIYCIKHYKETKYKFYWDNNKFKQIISFSGWNMFGSIATMGKGQGLNVLLNIFFNPSVNAARGIAYQVNNAATQFFNSFYTAVQPQIVKYYVQNELNNMLNLVFRSSRMLFFLMLIISLPILIETPFIIQTWLGQTPEYVIPFTRLIIIITIIDSMSNPLMTTIQATGKIKKYQITMSCTILMVLPISYIFLRIGYPAVTVFYVSLFISILCYFLRLLLIQGLVKFPIRVYMQNVIFKCLLCGIIAISIPTIILNLMNCSLIRFLLSSSVCFISSTVTIWFIGMTKEERKKFKQFAKKKFTCYKQL